MENIIEILKENFGVRVTNIIGVIILIIGYFPVNKLYSNYKTSNDLGIATSISKIINIIKDICMWIIIILLEGILLAEVIPEEVFSQNSFLIAICFGLLSIAGISCWSLLKSIGIKIKKDFGFGFFLLNFLDSIYIACWSKVKMFANESSVNSKWGYIEMVFILSIVLEYMLLLYSDNMKKRYTFYYADGIKCYLHKITNKEVICSYNRVLNRKNGYKIEKIQNVKKNRLFCEYEDTSYSYFCDVLLQNKIKVLKNEEVIDITLDDIEKRLNVIFTDKDKKIPQYYWGVVFLIKASKKRWLKEKLNEVQGAKNNSLILKTKQKNTYVVFLYQEKHRPSKKIFTDSLDKYVEDVASKLEYNFVR